MKNEIQLAFINHKMNFNRSTSVFNDPETNVFIKLFDKNRNKSTTALQDYVIKGRLETCHI